MGATDAAPPTASTALREATFAGLIAAGLSFPILALGTEIDFSNRLVLEQRWSWLVIAAALVFVGRLCALLLIDWRARFIAVPGTFPLVGGAALAAMTGAAGLSDGLVWMAIGAVLIVAGFALDRRLAARGAATASVPAPRATNPLFGKVLPSAGVIGLFLFPLIMLWLLGPAGSLKWINNYGIQILIFVMLGWGLNIVVGLAGLLDLGYVAFYAVGAYAYALLSTQFGLSFWLCLPLAGLFAALWGLMLGFPVLRLRGDYLAIVTLAFGEIIGAVLTNWTDLTNGKAGIMSIPRITFFGLPFTSGEGGFASTFGLEFSAIHRTIFLFYLILCLALLTNFVTIRLRRMPVGRAWEALREDEIACRSLGINTTNTKLTAFALGAMFGGFAGSFFAVRQGFVNPDSFTFLESATILAVVVLGGMGSQIGVALAAIVMVGGTEILRELAFLKSIFGNSFDPALYRMLIFGFAMVVMMIWRPRGLISGRSPSVALRSRKTVSGALVNEGHG
ncbi:MAG: branched-chain amino acid transporter permease [Hyphomicrobiales bacterium]|nr:branched-chain amino acid transporter permease [Hyphomicrobiales bacterium]